MVATTSRQAAMNQFVPRPPNPHSRGEEAGAVGAPRVDRMSRVNHQTRIRGDRLVHHIGAPTRRAAGQYLVNECPRRSPCVPSAVALARRTRPSQLLEIHARSRAVRGGSSCSQSLRIQQPGPTVRRDTCDHGWPQHAQLHRCCQESDNCPKETTTMRTCPCQVPGVDLGVSPAWRFPSHL